MKPCSIESIMASSRFSQRPAPQNKPPVCKKSQRQAPQPDPVNGWPMISGSMVRAYANFESQLPFPEESWNGLVMLTPIQSDIWEGIVQHSNVSRTRIRFLYSPSTASWQGEAAYRAESGNELFTFLGPPPEVPERPFLLRVPFRDSISDPGRIEVTFSL